jgi:acetylornithine deacetylase
MDIFSFTRALIDLESITGNEEQVARYIAAFLQQSGIAAELQEVEPHRFNVYAAIGTPVVVLSTHMDTVPPFLPSREDEHNIYGRGSCDAKGIIAAQVFAALELLQSGGRDFALLFMVGEERNSTGALWAN